MFADSKLFHLSTSWAMARRTSSATQVTVKLGHDAVDHNGVALQHDIIVSPNDDSVIAPWIDEYVSFGSLSFNYQ